MDEPKVKQESKVPLNQQEKALSELHELISMLSNKLEPILTPVMSEPSEASDKERPLQSPIVESLTINNASIRRASRRLGELLDRVEC